MQEVGEVEERAGGEGREVEEEEIGLLALLEDEEAASPDDVPGLLLALELP